MFDAYKDVGTHSYISLSAYYRLKLPSILVELDKVLYLDCDVIVNTSLKDLYDTDITDYYAAGVKDIAMTSSGYVPKLENNNIYFNTGVLLLNLDKMRKDKIEIEFEDYTIKNIQSIKVGDQEILNKVC